MVLSHEGGCGTAPVSGTPPGTPAQGYPLKTEEPTRLGTAQQCETVQQAALGAAAKAVRRTAGGNDP